MDITWFGHACCRLRDRNIMILTDPYDNTTGYDMPRLKPDVVTVSHADPHHDYVQACKGEPFVIAGPGEYEIKGVFITGTATFHDNKKGALRGANTVYMFEFDGLNVCHLGDLGHVPTQSQVESLSHVDVLLIPVGGTQSLRAAEAAEVIGLLEPKIVIPIHYKTPQTTLKLESVNNFVKEVGAPAPEPIEMLKVTASSLPEETQIVLLQPKQGG
jgi:L-ascorbate metabolism protein UlaG (beta-lactamase superfamily)